MLRFNFKSSLAARACFCCGASKLGACVTIANKQEGNLGVISGDEAHAGRGWAGRAHINHWLLAGTAGLRPDAR
eukprot:scaffold82920_cov16-Tisochrysis_lutea.AAC.1